MLTEFRNKSLTEYLKNLDPNAHNNEYSLWRATKYIKRPAKRNIPIRNNNDQWFRSGDEQAEAFAQHLHSVFQPNDIENAEFEKEVDSFLESPCQMSLPIRKIRYNEVVAEIKCVNNKKAPGFDKIDGSTIKILPKKCLRYLTYVYNAMLRLDYYPSQWKCAEVIMIPKPNKPENLLSSYRPISLLSTFSKVFEKILLRRMLPILDLFGIIPEHQFGFRKGHGTPEQVHRIINEITTAFESKKYCAAAFLDVQQAFDRVWHKGILYKIKKWLPAPYFLLMKSYLNERYFYVQQKDATSSLQPISAGVPQGSVLGPILYILFTADMPVSEETTVATYADDTAIIASSTCISDVSQKLQQELSLIEVWFKRWKIKVNEQKSMHITFALRRGDCPEVFFNGSAIPKSDTVKYLGLHLDRRLTWKTHIKAKRQQLKLKTKRMNWLLGRKSQTSLENKVRLYKAILKPVWTYGIQLWGTASSSNIEILQQYQSKTLRSIVNAPYYVTNKNIHKDLNIPYVKDEISLFSKKYIGRLLEHNNNLAINLTDNSLTIRRLKRLHVLDLADELPSTSG